MQTSTTSTITNTLSHQTESNTIFHYSSDFLEWLRTEQISLAVSTYQTNKLFLIGRDTKKHLFVSEKSFDRAMGLHVESENSFYLSTRFLLWRFENALAEGQIHKEADKVYIPRQAFTTGDLDAHDISRDENGDIVFVNTRYNCIAKISEKYNFKPLWIPPFITRMVSEDRCHLNGMAMRDGKPRYVTMVSQTDRLDAWREHRHNGGVVMDMQTSEVLAEGLSMPHSPRYYQDKLWVLNAGKGEFGYINSETNKFVAITQLDGFLRGLAFYKNYAIIGLSKPRHERTFAGLPLEEILNQKQVEPKCGIWIIDSTTGEIVHSLEAEGEIVELYDVQVLPNTKRPFTIDLKTDDITRFIAIEGDDDTVDFRALTNLEEDKNKFQSPYSRTESSNPKEIIQENTVENKPINNPIDKSKSTYSNHINPNLSSTSKEAIYYQASVVSLAEIIQEGKALTFPNIELQAKVTKINEPLMVIIARNHQQLLGGIVIENMAQGVAKVLSWYVLPHFRDLGIGKELLMKANKLLLQNKFTQVHIKYRSDWKSIEKFEQILQENEWLEPLKVTGIYKFVLEEAAQADWINTSYTNSKIEMFLWQNLSSKEKQEILYKKSESNWYDDTVSPFINESTIVSSLSFGLRYEGKVFGWLITHTTQEGILQFSTLFVDTKIIGNAIGNYTIFLSLVSNGITKAVEEGYKYGLFQAQTENSTMTRFVDRYLRSYLITETNYIRNHKNLNLSTPQTTTFQQAEQTSTNSLNSSLTPSASQVNASNIEYRIYKLDVQNALQHFNQLTFPRLEEIKLGRKLNEPLAIIVAQDDKQQFGSAILELQPQKGSGQLLSWYVLPPFRRMGIGKELVNQVEKLLKQNKYSSIHTSYRSDWKSLDSFEHILAKRKWENPKTVTYFCKSSIDIIIEAPWMKKLQLPTGMELFLWKEVTQQEKQEILHKKQTQNWYPDVLSPFQFEEKMDLATSVGLKYEGQIVGWMVTHRLKPDTVEFTAAFVDQNAVGGGLRKQSLFLPVLAKSLHFLNEDGAKYGIWQMQVDNPSIQKFLDKFLKPYLISLVESKISYKVL